MGVWGCPQILLRQLYKDKHYLKNVILMKKLCHNGIDLRFLDHPVKPGDDIYNPISDTKRLNDIRRRLPCHSPINSGNPDVWWGRVPYNTSLERGEPLNSYWILARGPESHIDTPYACVGVVHSTLIIVASACPKPPQIAPRA